MIRVHIFVEGQTEETFVRELLYTHFLQQNIYVNPILLGGAVTYGKIRKELYRKCSEDSTAFVTTMLDLYGLPKDFPGKSSVPSTSNPFDKAEYLEQQMSLDIDKENFIPNLLLHEFEGLLYSNPQAFLEWFDQTIVEQLQSERESFPSPEHINDSPTTAPSKRILRCCPRYDKPLHGSLIAMDIGLDKIREQCQHFDQWLTKLENIK
ncbi:DUF4276 family protein [Trichormus variabilis]|uniref:DUF4276 domain-containing protein n=1 Tax=Trichormus variabilis SAG 1403-4b TaxID=447716 RepID=A0A433V0V8_ANAVA|nr:DUF4276 family protein [Trichormus variabilis]MBD2625347.1 DUF4276 family protein [Trichormus variabilis FACHB-164]RUS99721.1 hypothetical protein DSM107003_03050 [Trichormus variabilis SAG 1403-4b]